MNWIDLLEIHNTEPPYYIADGVEIPFDNLRGMKIKECLIYEYFFAQDKE